MKILHILSQRPDSTGSGTYLQALLRESHLHGHQNSLVAGVNSDSPPPSTLMGLETSSYVTFDSANLSFLVPGMTDVMPYPSSRFSNLTGDQVDQYCKAFHQHIKMLITDWRPDIIHSHHLWLISSLVKQSFPDIPMVTSCHGTDLRQLQLCPHMQQQVVEGCSKIDRILALSQAQKSEICSRYLLDSERVTVVGAGFDETVFYPAPKPSVVPLQLLYCGKLNRPKGVPWLLQAIAQLPDNLCHLHLVGEGSGPDRQECLSLANTLGNRITVRGALQQSQLADLMRQCHLFILPSLFEGMPLVVLEALACNCQVITTKLPGCLEIAMTTGTDRLSLIDLPRMKTIDQPMVEEEEVFAERIRSTLLEAITNYSTEKFSPDTCAASASSFTWGQVFKRINNCYKHILN